MQAGNGARRWFPGSYWFEKAVGKGTDIVQRGLFPRGHRDPRIHEASKVEEEEDCTDTTEENPGPA